jgi:hypothetical protein
MSTLLCLVMLAGTVTGIALGFGRPRRSHGILLAELTMLVAMTDVCLGAVLLLLEDGGGHLVAGASHHTPPVPLVVRFAAAAMLHAGFEVRLAVREQRGRARPWAAAARGASAIAGTGAMVAMVAVAG